MEGVRGLAVLLVFFVHFHALFGEFANGRALLWEPSQFLGIVGNIGVDLFFVLSGYLIYGALIRRKTGFMRFVWRRGVRIYPTFLAVFSMYLILSALFPQKNKIHGPWTSVLMYIVQNLLLLPGIFDIKPIITVAWSLSYEFFFYLSAPFLVWVTRMWGWKRATRAVFIVAVWFLYLFYSFSISTSHVRLLMFTAGMLLYDALSSEKFKRMLSRPGEMVAVVLFLVSFVYAYFLNTHQKFYSIFPAWQAGRNPIPGVFVYQGPYLTAVLSISCFWFVAYCFAFDGFLKRIFCWSPLRYLGNMSYSYYLTHGVTLQAVALFFLLAEPSQGNLRLAFFAALITGLAATWISSTVLFSLVEKPISLRGRAGSSSVLMPVHQVETGHA